MSPLKPPLSVICNLPLLFLGTPSKVQLLANLPFKNTSKGLKTVSHGGAFLGFRTQFVRFPEQKFSVIIFSNFSDLNPTAKAYEITDILLDDQLVKKPNDIVNSDTLQKFELNQLIGNYEIQPTMNLVITINDDSLHFEPSWERSS